MSNASFDTDKWIKEKEQKLKNDPEYIAYGIMLDISSQITNRLNELNWKQKDLAERLNKSQGWISRLLNAPTNFSIKKLVEVALAIDLKLDVQMAKTTKADSRKTKVLPSAGYVNSRQEQHKIKDDS
ncbi:MAG TPA: helix-turn-helix transcriptional regulator [Fodinibius sp.]|nr:helix-turn-helix transcriptional regulator [Fodinibius sp.]